MKKVFEFLVIIYQLKASARLAKFQKTVWKTAMGYDWKNFDDESSVKRQFRTFSILGTAALPDEEFSKVNFHR